MSKVYQPKTGQRCTCKRGVQRDNCPNCEGTGWVINFRAIREGTNDSAIYCPRCGMMRSQCDCWDAVNQPRA